MSPSFSNGASSLPEHCKAAVCVNRGPSFQLELRHDREVPRPGKGQLLLKLSATGLCSSDYHFMRDDWGFSTAPGVDVVGHEGAGVVVALGPEVDANEWKVGDRAGVKPYYSTCGKCRLCKTGFEPHCPSAIAYGAAANGSYSQYCLTYADYTTRIPDGLPDHIAAPILCSGATTYAAIKKSGAKAGQWLVVPGAGGGVGSMAVQYARAMGIRVLAIDGGEKEAMCHELGAEAFIDFKTCEDIKGQVEQITDGGAHAILVTGGSRSAYADTHLMLRTGGTMVCLGMPPTGQAIAGGDPNMLIMKGITITGSLVAGSVDVDEALDMAARGQVEFANIHVHQFEEWPALIAKLGAGQIVGRAVVSFD